MYALLNEHKNISLNLHRSVPLMAYRANRFTINGRRKRVRLDVGKFSFSNRVVNEWNMLDE